MSETKPRVHPLNQLVHIVRLPAGSRRQLFPVTSPAPEPAGASQANPGPVQGMLQNHPPARRPVQLDRPKHPDNLPGIAQRRSVEFEHLPEKRIYERQPVSPAAGGLPERQVRDRVRKPRVVRVHLPHDEDLFVLLRQVALCHGIRLSGGPTPVDAT